MKGFFVGISVVLLSVCLSEAESKVSVPLLGSKQVVESSEFCKKYKCRAMPRENGLGYVLELPTDLPWSDIMDYLSSKGKVQPQLWREYRTLMDVSVDRKTGQVAAIEFGLRENSRGNKGTHRAESVMLADAIYYITGKRLILNKSQGELYSRDISDCFVFARGFIKENISPLTRVMMTGEVTLQVDKKKAKYRGVCSANSNGSTPQTYLPAFWIEIPSFINRKVQGDN